MKGCEPTPDQPGPGSCRDKGRMRRIRMGLLFLGLLYFPLFFGFMSYDFWLWRTGAQAPAGGRTAAVHQHGQARYVTAGQAAVRELLQVGALILFGAFFVSAGVEAVLDRRGPRPR